jgi:hypothetical protein
MVSTGKAGFEGDAAMIPAARRPVIPVRIARG